MAKKIDTSWAPFLMEEDAPFLVDEEEEERRRAEEAARVLAEEEEAARRKRKLASVKINSWALKYADDAYKNDREIVLAAVTQKYVARGPRACKIIHSTSIFTGVCPLLCRACAFFAVAALCSTRAPISRATARSAWRP